MCCAVPLQATDADGDALTFAVTGLQDLPSGTLQSDGTLVFRPPPGQLGTYQFDVIATDGALQDDQQVTLNVVADPVTTTRIAGQVLKVEQPAAGRRARSKSAPSTA